MSKKDQYEVRVIAKDVNVLTFTLKGDEHIIDLMPPIDGPINQIRIRRIEPNE